MSKKMKTLIVVSLLLNVLLVGIIIGHALHRFGGKHFFRRYGAELTVRLPADKEKLFFETMKQVHMENKDIRKQIRETREKAISILTAPEFDETAYQIEAEKLHELRGRMMQQLAGATKELAAHFNQEERKALAKHLRRPPRPPLGVGRLNHGKLGPNR